MCSKFVAFAATSSGTMLSEGIHSLADVLNQCLLFLGIVLARRQPDADHPYGFYNDRFIWAMISAVGIFFLGSGVTAYHGVRGLFHPRELERYGWAYAVLTLSFVLEGVVFLIALRTMLRQAAGRPLGRYLREQADPNTIAVLLEDGVAVTGVVLAMGAISLVNVTGAPVWDAIGTLIIAALLGCVAVILIALNRRLLIDTAVPLPVREKVLKVLHEAPSVEGVYDFKSRMLSVDRYSVKAEIEFEGRAIAKRLRVKIRAAYPKIQSFEQFQQFCEQFADDVIEALGDEIDDLEARIRSQVPGVKHVDIETD